MSFKILALDGGGVRGVIAARILQEVEQEIRNQGKGNFLYEYFDLISGTSTGSMLTGAIALGKESHELINLYKDRGQDIFPLERKDRYKNLPPIIKSILDVFSGPKYSHDGIINALKDTYKSTKIKDIEKPIILILAYDTLYRNTTFFTNCHPDLGDRWYDDCYLWQICTASASAPTFFPPYKLEPVDKEKFGDWEFPHIDGGVSANNPCLAALSLAMRISQSSVSPTIKQKYKLDNLRLEDISILSIGTGQTGEPYQYKQISKWRGLDWIQNLTNIFMEPTSEIDSTICRQIMGGYDSKRYLRLQFDLNETFKAKPDETYKDPRIVLPPEERKNRFTGEKVSPEIDNASLEIIEQLINTTAAFIDKGLTYYTRDDSGSPIKEAIASFIKDN
ncbi:MULTISPECIES: patatin-like phospholipase family protein [unclassified Nostoc]|uniref:patatin-like phospholipase family protein n=1 Tax=unclassified Nostoc TaxID=2593658 RepID=UPI002AD2DE9C|nr:MULTISPECIES: patatin-like phospholipase family protein [unclassified Nostoc]MDZ8124465.1 patatin-like phospholipase family protein [Nostoc sp. CmiVER01]MDZ8223517.1 patatin-like phospholipase family protein [Nostoc sp. ChiVER01]